MKVWLQLFPSSGSNGAESEGSSSLGVPDGVVVGQVHEFVHQVGLVQVGGQRAQLLVCGQVLTGGRLAQSPLGENLRVLVNLIIL